MELRDGFMTDQSSANPREFVVNSATALRKSDVFLGKTLPSIGPVTVDNVWKTQVFRLEISDDLVKGLRNKNNKRAKHIAISQILDVLCTFGDFVELAIPPLFCFWKGKAFVVLPSALLWTELDSSFNAVDVYPAAILAYSDEFRQSYFCQDIQTITLLKELLIHMHVAAINFNDIMLTNGGFNGIRGNRNSRHIFPNPTEKLNYPLNESEDQLKYPTQVSEDDTLVSERTPTEEVPNSVTEMRYSQPSDVMIYNSTEHSGTHLEDQQGGRMDSVFTNSRLQVPNSNSTLDRMDLNQSRINGVDYSNAGFGNSSNARTALFSNSTFNSKPSTHSHINHPRAKHPDYENEDYRKETFRGWPLTHPNPDTLCAAGFFFTGHSYDLVRCFCCGIGLKDFSDSDDPLYEHAKHSANCEFMQDRFGREGIERIKQRHRNQDPEEIRQRQRELYQQQLSRPVADFRAKHERFRALSDRLDTYTHWPQHLSQRPEQLAAAGMYYTGVDDHCRCFACDGGLRKWEQGDDPWIEHCRWFPSCPYAREVKGDEFINLIQLSADQAAAENAPNQHDEVNGAVAALTVDDRIIQRIVDTNLPILTRDMGFPVDNVRNAVTELVQQGKNELNIDDIVTRLEVIDERKRTGTQLRIPEPESQPNNSKKAMRRVTFLTNVIRTKPTVKNLLLCHLCHKNQVNALFLPCTHHKYCLDCTHHSDRCPDCDRPIKERIRTYMG